MKRTSKVARKLLQSIVDAESPAKAVVTLGNTGAGPFDRVTIEFCCAHDSALGKSTGVRVREHINANSKACEEMVLEELRRVRRDSPQAQVFVYATLPCAGGSSWQHVKEANGPNEKVPERKKVFRGLLKSLRRLLIRLADYKPYLAFELPKTCAYWKWPEVQSLVKQYNLIKFRVDGCAVGVVDHAGALLLKSWCVASNVICVNVTERHLCDGKRKHGV